MLQLLSLIESFAGQVNSGNVQQFVSLVEGLVQLAEHINSAAQAPVSQSNCPNC